MLIIDTARDFIFTPSQNRNAAIGAALCALFLSQIVPFLPLVGCGIGSFFVIRFFQNINALIHEMTLSAAAARETMGRVDNLVQDTTQKTQALSVKSDATFTSMQELMATTRASLNTLTPQADRLIQESQQKVASLNELTGQASHLMKQVEVEAKRIADLSEPARQVVEAVRAEVAPNVAALKNARESIEQAANTANTLMTTLNTNVTENILPATEQTRQQVVRTLQTFETAAQQMNGSVRHTLQNMEGVVGQMGGTVKEAQKALKNANTGMDAIGLLTTPVTAPARMVASACSAVKKRLIGESKSSNEESDDEELEEVTGRPVTPYRSLTRNGLRELRSPSSPQNGVRVELHQSPLKLKK